MVAIYVDGERIGMAGKVEVDHGVRTLALTDLDPLSVAFFNNALGPGGAPRRVIPAMSLLEARGGRWTEARDVSVQDLSSQTRHVVLAAASVVVSTELPSWHGEEGY